MIDAANPPRHRPIRRLLAWAFTVLGSVFAAYYWAWLTFGPSNPADALTYYRINLDDLYGGWYLGGPDSFQYAPAFGQVVALVRGLPSEAFVALWRAASFVLLVWMAGPFTLPVMFLPPVASELNAGNINLMIAAAIVAGFRYPAAWSFVLLTKVTPGIGLLWFAVRREWRSLAIALGATAAIVAVSFLLLPEQWIAWLRLLMDHRGDPTSSFPYFVPLDVRLPIGALVVVTAAILGLPWLVVIGATIATPNLYFPTQAIAVGAVALLRHGEWRHGGPRPAALRHYRPPVRATRDSATDARTSGAPIG